MQVRFQGTFMVDKQLIDWRGEAAAARIDETARDEKPAALVQQLDDSIRLRYVARWGFSGHYEDYRHYDTGTDAIVVERRRDCGCLNDYDQTLFTINRDMPREESTTPVEKILWWTVGGKVTPANVGETVNEFIVRAAAEAKKRWESMSAGR